MAACTNNKLLLACTNNVKKENWGGDPFYVHGKNQIELPVYVK
jgi:hypothetical protein